MLPWIETPFTAMFGLKYPVVCAPMFLVSNPDMLVAAAEAGILGAVPSLNARTGEGFREMLAEVRTRTHGPFGVNLILLHNPRLQEDLAACLDMKVPLIITSLGDPTPVVQAAHERGTRVFCDVVSMRHARKAQAAGADGLIAVAAGAGGHAGPIAQNVLVPWLLRETGLPVLAAGGIATGRGLLSALALGACAAYMGTRFIASRESPAPQEYKDMILRATPEDIRMTDKVTGHPANFLGESLDAIEQDPEHKKPWRDAWSAGHTAGLVGRVQTMAEIVADLVDEYEQAMAHLPGKY